jgi:glyoxylase-like metal-dependent hydrolase (beta-lactamase superfamily II)
MKTILSILITLIATPVLSQNTFVYNTANAEVILLAEINSTRKADNLIGYTPEIAAETAPDNTYPGGTNAFLVKTDGKNILVDTGLGRELFKNLETHGVKPEDVGIILITHLHADHFLGLVRDGKRAFPAAKVYLSLKERENTPENAKKILELYADDIKTFEPKEDPTSLVHGISSMAAYGHTPGHTVFIVDNLMIWGDLTHAMAIQMPYPRVAISYDTDPVMAVNSRLRILEYVIKNKMTVAGMHIPYPSIGNVSSVGAEKYLFTPAK